MFFYSDPVTGVESAQERMHVSLSDLANVFLIELQLQLQQ